MLIGDGRSPSVPGSLRAVNASRSADSVTHTHTHARTDRQTHTWKQRDGVLIESGRQIIDSFLRLLLLVLLLLLLLLWMLVGFLHCGMEAVSLSVIQDGRFDYVAAFFCFCFLEAGECQEPIGIARFQRSDTSSLIPVIVVAAAVVVVVVVVAELGWQMAPAPPIGRCRRCPS